MEKKILVRGEQKEVNLYDLFDNKSIAKTIDAIIDLANNLEGEELKFEIDDPHSYNMTIYLQSYRLETNKEFNRRMEMKDNLKLREEEIERKEYERLKKKYGQTNN